MPSICIFNFPIGTLFLAVNQIITNPNSPVLTNALERYKTLLLRIVINQTPYIKSNIIILGEVSLNSITKKIDIIPTVNIYNNKSTLSGVHISYPLVISDGYFYFDFALSNNSEVIESSSVFTIYDYTQTYQTVTKKMQVNFGPDKKAAMQLDFQLEISKERLQQIENERYRLKKLQPNQYSSVQIGVQNEKWAHFLPSFVSEYQNLFTNELRFNSITCMSPEGVLPTFQLFFNKL